MTYDHSAIFEKDINAAVAGALSKVDYSDYAALVADAAFRYAAKEAEADEQKGIMLDAKNGVLSVRIYISDNVGHPHIEVGSVPLIDLLRSYAPRKQDEAPFRLLANQLSEMLAAL